jgi:hypothetical protein
MSSSSRRRRFGRLNLMAQADFGDGLRAAREAQMDTAAAADIGGAGRAPAFGTGSSADGPDHDQNKDDHHDRE